MIWEENVPYSLFILPDHEKHLVTPGPTPSEATHRYELAGRYHAP
jgi:hypothetical protein